ncbi:MAG: hypothetical protein EOT04_00085 [Candidatus Chaera renei]|uniref:Uncharacterized protein n=1 Tax=Candidatus Chaera renei TaxID=2506947 RepID=A0A4Q0ALH3_9BACT|nr:MAG: hypothetical protein EOT04_00085 [Candidatus Chaera renei]
MPTPKRDVTKVKKDIAGGTAHATPVDLRRALNSAPVARAAWNSLTPLARNEWICWNTTVKQPKTRKRHIERTVAELQQGKRRPCCWMGCVHRADKPISPSARWVLGKIK